MAILSCIKNSEEAHHHFISLSPFLRRDVTRILGIISQLFFEASKGADIEFRPQSVSRYQPEVVFQPRIATKFFLVAAARWSPGLGINRNYAKGPEPLSFFVEFCVFKVLTIGRI